MSGSQTQIRKTLSRVSRAMKVDFSEQETTIKLNDSMGMMFLVTDQLEPPFIAAPVLGRSGQSRW